MPDEARAVLLVMGAGAIGCYLGGCLRAAGADVVFVGRPRVLDALREHGLTLTDLDGGRQHIEPAHLTLADRVPAGLAPQLVLLSVKSAATEDAAAQLDAALPPGTPVVSMQNGVSNAPRAQAKAPRLRVRAGMVPFNVAELGNGHFHRGTSGALAAEDDPVLRDLQPLFERAGIALQLRADLLPVLWGKLLLNLNNPVNALSGRPLRAQLLERGYRRCLAALQEEAMSVLEGAGITPAQVAALPPRKLPSVLRLPTPLFRLIALRMLRVDEKARSSMADDLALGRPTEIDALCGEVVRLAQAQQRDAPMNRRMVELVRAWPARPQPLAPEQMLAALGLR